VLDTRAYSLQLASVWFPAPRPSLQTRTSGPEASSSCSCIVPVNGCRRTAEARRFERPQSALLGREEASALDDRAAPGSRQRRGPRRRRRFSPGLPRATRVLAARRKKARQLSKAGERRLECAVPPVLFELRPGAESCKLGSSARVASVASRPRRLLARRRVRAGLLREAAARGRYCSETSTGSVRGLCSRSWCGMT
jgi:hypothetical protein